jgi:glycosyltransferase involved in cell wall biosynthesis
MTAHPLTIVQMIPELHGGGVERGTIEISEELVRQGHRSIVISAGGPLVSQLQEHGAEHVQWNIRSKSPLSLRWVRPLRRFLNENNVDILHARSRIPGWIAYLCWKRMNAATRPHFVTTAHGLYSVNKYSEVMTRGERVIAISETVSSYLKDNYPRINAASITTIPRGIDPADFPRHFQPSQQWLQDWFEEFPQLAGRPTISLIGRLTRLKGHLDLIKIVDKLRYKIPDIQALIVGSVDPRRAQYAEEVHAEVKRRKLEKNIVFAGQRSEIREIYSVSNVVLSLT